MTKLLFFKWHSFMNEGIERGLQKLDIPYDTYFYQFTDWECDNLFMQKFGEVIQSGMYRKVLSVNFSPLISDICEEYGIPYVAWIYDAPVHIRNLEPMKNSCNTLYFFDRVEAENYKKIGVMAKHLPLAADVELFQQKIRTAKWQEHYQISMVGNLYQTDYVYFMNPLDGYLKGYFEAIVNSQMKIYGGYLIPELLTDDLLFRMNGIYARVAADGFKMGRRELEFMLAQEVTRRERCLVLSVLSEHYPVDVYSYKADDNLRKVHFHGYADYETQVPAIFAGSDVNLNISLKCIQSGIPLRAIEVMASGGFLLSNYQMELGEYFEIGQECEVYESLEDLYAKTEFYLKNEELRNSIANRGTECIKRDFNFEVRLKELLGD